MATETPCDRTNPHAAHGWGDDAPTNVCWGVQAAGDFDCCAPLGPDCRDGKHPACTGDAIDEHTDQITTCTCTCHERSAA